MLIGLCSNGPPFRSLLCSNTVQMPVQMSVQMFIMSFKYLPTLAQKSYVKEVVNGEVVSEEENRHI